MLPLTLLATNKLLNLLTLNNALSKALSSNAAAAGVDVPPLDPDQIITSYAPADICDLNLQLRYPRVCIYTTQLTNNQREKFRAFSGAATVTIDVWSSAELEQTTEIGLHFLAEGIAEILQANLGDWGDGFRYSGIYEIQMHAPKMGGTGFLQLARITCDVHVTY